MFGWKVVMVTLVLSCLLASSSEQNSNQDYVDLDDAREFLAEFDKQIVVYCKKTVLAQWNYQTNISEANQKLMVEAGTEFEIFLSLMWEIADQFPWRKFKDMDPKIHRMFTAIDHIGRTTFPLEKSRELQKLISDMMSSISSAQKYMQSSKGKNENFSNSSSEKYEELKQSWVQWRNVTGKVKNAYLRYIDLKNEDARHSGFSDAGEFWRSEFECDNFQEQIDDLWYALFPLYAQIHAYVRRKLLEIYPNKMRKDGPIPAHVLGTIGTETWINTFDLVRPYPSESEADATYALIRKNITLTQMLKISEAFFTSLGLQEMPAEFWKNSIIEKPSDREIVCHPSAWDFCDGKDLRIKMCAHLDMRNLITMHHEMGHLQYSMQYAHQPFLFRDGANPGFHEAVGDAIALSVSTPKHLQKIGLLDEVKESEKSDINYLLNMALNKIVLLPFAYVMDVWRWNVFSGNIARDELNTMWWELKHKHQGVCAPIPRTERDFDPGAKYHVNADVSYIRYFVGIVIQFQIHKALCKEAGHAGPLHKCDIYQNKKAGKLLSDVLRLGSSVHWTEAMLVLTKGETNQMDVSGIVEYFDPLIEWLEIKNRGAVIGWESDGPSQCP